MPMNSAMVGLAYMAYMSRVVVKESDFVFPIVEAQNVAKGISYMRCGVCMAVLRPHGVVKGLAPLALT